MQVRRESLGREGQSAKEELPLRGKRERKTKQARTNNISEGKERKRATYVLRQISQQKERKTRKFRTIFGGGGRAFEGRNAIRLKTGKRKEGGATPENGPRSVCCC